MNEQLTQWFPPEVKPVWHGWYERDWDGGQNKWECDCDWWDGEHWRNSPHGHAWIHGGKDLPWRGLAQKP